MTIGDPVRSRHRILIVDDQPANVRVMAEALRDQYDLFFATNGQRALEIVSTSGIELVLLDVVMPEMDGFEVCRRIKDEEQTNHIPVIFVTAREEVSDETRGFEAGGVDYITKPIQPQLVRARVRTQLELKRARDLLAQLANFDGLTGIPNRRRFDMTLAAEWRRAVRTRSWFSLALIDVDFFKRYNDTYGHAKGDDCLRAIAGAIHGVARRSSDLAARYGGEEFVILAPDTESIGMRAMVEAVVQAVRDLGIEHASSMCERHATVSIGAVSLVPTDGDEVEVVVQTADRMLYEAKEQGRNRAAHLDLTTGVKQWMGLSITPADAGSVSGH